MEIAPLRTSLGIRLIITEMGVAHTVGPAFLLFHT